jgi:hypothetical protein
MTEILRDSSTPRDPAALVVGAIAAQVIGGLVPQMSPFVIAGFMDGLSLSEREAGFIASTEFLALAVTAIAIAPVLPRLLPAAQRHLGLLLVFDFYRHNRCSRPTKQTLGPSLIPLVISVWAGEIILQFNPVMPLPHLMEIHDAFRCAS